jgi:hypothetical protein
LQPHITSPARVCSEPSDRTGLRHRPGSGGDPPRQLVLLTRRHGRLHDGNYHKAAVQSTGTLDVSSVREPPRHVSDRGDLWSRRIVRLTSARSYALRSPVRYPELAWRPEEVRCPRCKAAPHTSCHSRFYPALLAVPAHLSRRRLARCRGGAIGTSGVRYRATRLARHTALNVLLWGLAVAALLLLSPNWIDAVDAGLLSTVLAPSLIALFALLFASTFVAAQTAVSLYGARAALVLLSELRLLACISRMGVLLICVFLAAAATVANGHHQPALIPAFLVVAVAITLVELLRLGNDLAIAFSRATAPRLAAQHLKDRVLTELLAGTFDTVEWEAATLSGMLHGGLIRRDPAAIEQSLEAMKELHRIWAELVPEVPEWRTPVLNGNADTIGWLTVQFVDSIARAAEDAMAAGGSVGEVDGLIGAVGEIGLQAASSGLDHESFAAIDALTVIGTSAQQVSHDKVNLQPAPVWLLAHIEAAAEPVDRDVASVALAAWGLCVANIYIRFRRHHPAREGSLRAFGRSPPFDEARALISSDDWQAEWVNQHYGVPEFAIYVLDVAEANCAGQQGPPVSERFRQHPKPERPPGRVVRTLARLVSDVVELIAEDSRDVPDGWWPEPWPLGRPSSDDGSEGHQRAESRDAGRTNLSSVDPRNRGSGG